MSCAFPWVRRWLPALILMALVAAPARARAQATVHSGGHSADADAVALGHAGLDAFQAGRWATAYDTFQRAERLSHSPVFVLFMARCRRNAGALNAARVLYLQIAGEPLQGSAPDSWRAAVRDATAEMATMTSRIPSVVVSLINATSDDTVVRIDGQIITVARLGGEIDLDPGPHHLVARRGDGAQAEADFTLDEARRAVEQRVVMPVRPTALRAHADSAVISADISPLVIDQPPSATSGTRSLAYVAVGIGGVGLALGAITGLWALSRTNSIKDGCTGNVCPAGDASRAESARRLATWSTIGFIAGGVGLASGAVLLWISPAPLVQPDRQTRSPVAIGLRATF
jgi:hypothetical protein